MAIQVLNPKAEVARAAQALAINISAAKGLQDVLKTNLGPKGTMKMLVSGAGEIKITKDGNVLLNEMQIQHPTASLIARVATAQDDIYGDGTSSTILIIGELLKQADLYVSEGLHPRLITDGFELAKDKACEILDKLRSFSGKVAGRDCLVSVAKTSLRTKVHPELADHLSEIIVDAVLQIKRQDIPIDLHMIEIMTMMHKQDTDSSLIKGIVFDHGSRHPNMPKILGGEANSEVFILTCNVSLEYEKTEVNSGFFYKSAEEREKLVANERKFTEERVKKIIALKKEVCGDDKNKTFMVVNQKGIDPPSLDLLAREGIVALRRAKRRNMERITLACGGEAVNSVDDLTPAVLGKAGLMREYVLGEEKYTYIERCLDPHSVTILVKGPNKHTINQVNDAIHDGMRAVKNALDDDCVVPGAGAFEVCAYKELMNYMNEVKGRPKLGVKAFAEALLVIPKVLATNAGQDSQDAIVTLLDANSGSIPLGLDLASGQPMDPLSNGVLDNYCVKRHILQSCCVVSSNLLLVDEVMRAGLSSLKG